MKKTPENATEPEMRAEYDFSRGIRGKYARRYARGANLVLLAPDVARLFPDSDSVNSSLRALAGIIRRQRKALPSK
jgi:hypothetical protein